MSAPRMVARLSPINLNQLSRRLARLGGRSKSLPEDRKRGPQVLPIGGVTVNRWRASFGHSPCKSNLHCQNFFELQR
jgi:hypothetical protein